MNFNLPFSKECLKYKALKMTFGRGPLLPQKYIIIQNVGKNYHSDIVVHDKNRERFNMSK